jgi:hypothetical protein
LNRSIFSVALAGIALTSFSIGAHAQMATVVKPVQFGIAAGAALPTSDLSDIANTGFNVTGTVAINPQMIPLGIRIDGAYNRFAFKQPIVGLTGPGASTTGGDIASTSVTGNLVYKVPSAAFSPYLIGGAGWYSVSGFSSTSDNHFGWNLGGGILMPLSGFDTFIEARYNQVQFEGGSLKYIPITFGILF